jgi:hypothetical protein
MKFGKTLKITALLHALVDAVKPGYGATVRRIGSLRHFDRIAAARGRATRSKVDSTIQLLFPAFAPASIFQIETLACRHLDMLFDQWTDHRQTSERIVNPDVAKFGIFGLHVSMVPYAAKAEVIAIFDLILSRE